MQQGQILTTVIVVIPIEMMSLNEFIWQEIEPTMLTFTPLMTKQKGH
ncbi:MAG: hypothetical protein AAGG02_21325 [Cyanobacteria bacterium P01_H01_bin.15]